MAAINWQNVVDEAPELAGTAISALFQIVILNVVNGAGLSADNFGGEDADLTRAARICLAAHMATLSKRRGQPGAIQSQSEGGASQSYWFGLANPRLLYMTGYGQLLSQLIMGTPARAGILL